MFGPLPLLHRIVLALVTAASGVLAGAWAAHVTALPLAVSMGAVAGGLLGLVAAYAVVHAAATGAGHPPPLTPPAVRVGGVPDPTPTERRAIIRDGLGVGLATGLYGVSFGAVSVAAGLSVLQTCALSVLAQEILEKATRMLIRRVAKGDSASRASILAKSA